MHGSMNVKSISDASDGGISLKFDTLASTKTCRVAPLLDKSRQNVGQFTLKPNSVPIDVNLTKLVFL
jgi:hypothetical protein